MTRVVCIGECMVELRHDGDHPLSAAMRQFWRTQGVLDELAFVAAGKLPGLYLVDTDTNGERQFFYWRGESAARGWLSALQRQGAGALREATLLTLGAGEVALTLGAQGCLLPEGLAACEPCNRVQDTSGAGDSFNGAYLAARLRGMAPAQAARAGLSLAARVVAHRGALISPSSPLGMP